MQSPRRTGIEEHGSAVYVKAITNMKLHVDVANRRFDQEVLIYLLRTEYEPTVSTLGNNCMIRDSDG
jgi:hypothetical protein